MDLAGEEKFTAGSVGATTDAAAINFDFCLWIEASRYATLAPE